MPASLIDEYAPLSGRFDEMLDDRHAPRPSWHAFSDKLAQLSDRSLTQRAAFVTDAVQTDGISYNVYADPKGMNRPWEIDMLPMIIGADEWSWLSEAVAQRAALLNGVLDDLYGDQHLLKEGLLPPALIFGQSGFKWPCHGIRPPGGYHLNLYAVDLARAPDGSWWVIADRTQGPSGAGYALQNRVVVSQAFTDAFRTLRVEKLVSFFRSFQDGLTRMAPTDGESPLAVLLTPGPYNETYFEHAFLARYLGFPLVEGQDLTVRNNTVYLKTLRGLRRVHAIVRRLDDDYCDPLHLRADSTLGIPGLLGAIRAGRVLVANNLGSGVLESGALFGFLPGIAERLLNTPLKLPSVASWWCGEAPAMKYVLEHLDELVIKPAFPGTSMPAVFGHQLKGAERAQLIADIHSHPQAYVAQEWVKLSQAPVWNNARLTPRSIGLRLFAAATPEGYIVMPGGLTRVAPHGAQEIISMQRGGMSKDTWVQSRGPVHKASLLKKRLGVIDLLCSDTDVPSRVGENLFWMGRHSERCESSARVLRAALERIASGLDEVDQELAGLLAAARRIGTLPPASADTDPTPPELQLLAAVGEAAQPGSVAANLRALSMNANHVRERLSADNWHVLNRLDQAVQPAPDTPDQALISLDRVMRDCISLAGFALDDMTRDEGWRFLILGRRLERLAWLSALIAHVLQNSETHRERMLEWLLEAANSIVTYRARYRRSPELLPVVHLLVFDSSNPHSVAFQLQSLQQHLREGTRELGQPSPPRFGKLEQSLAHFDLSGFEARHCDSSCQALAALLGEAERQAYALSDEIHDRFFIHTWRATHGRRAA